MDEIDNTCDKRYCHCGKCGVIREKVEEVKITPEIQSLIDERDAARAAKDWKRADDLRDKLKGLGVDVHDKKL